MPKLLEIRTNVSEGNLTSADISQDGQTIYESDEQSNTHTSNLYRGVRLNILYNDLVATSNVEVQAVIQGKELSGVWTTVAYQFDPYRPNQSSKQRVILMDPSIFWPDAGISNIVYVGGQTIAEISPQQIVLPDTWRVVVKVSLPNPQETLTSLDMDITAEMINPQP